MSKDAFYVHGKKEKSHSGVLIYQAQKKPLISQRLFLSYLKEFYKASAFKTSFKFGSEGLGALELTIFPSLSIKINLGIPLIL